ncbi:MAG: ROK family protein [Verrucomicrobiota bacterium]
MVPRPKHPRVLVIDIGGSNVKFMIFGATKKRKFRSGASLTPARMAKETLALTQDWRYDVVSIGFPSPVKSGKPAQVPMNLGRGWVGYDFQKRFKKPVKIINDAAMQALGSYQGGRMLFLGLGTGFGSALISNDVILPLELCNLPYTKGKSIEDCLGKQTMKTMGKVKWQRIVYDVVAILKDCLLADYVVVGGGNAKHLQAPLPSGVKLGNNENAFLGGHRLWNTRPARIGRLRNESWIIV